MLVGLSVCESIFSNSVKRVTLGFEVFVRSLCFIAEGAIAAAEAGGGAYV